MSHSLFSDLLTSERTRSASLICLFLHPFAFLFYSSPLSESCWIIAGKGLALRAPPEIPLRLLISYLIVSSIQGISSCSIAGSHFLKIALAGFSTYFFLLHFWNSWPINLGWWRKVSWCWHNQIALKGTESANRKCYGTFLIKIMFIH